MYRGNHRPALPGILKLWPDGLRKLDNVERNCGMVSPCLRGHWQDRRPRYHSHLSAGDVSAPPRLSTVETLLVSIVDHVIRV